ncbi:hypothetical protein BHE74_00001600 [Ensete ventricosum]|nr:hypothetical protein BHE74_00001600 [Ensete ventricosum]
MPSLPLYFSSLFFNPVLHIPAPSTTPKIFRGKGANESNVEDDCFDDGNSTLKCGKGIRDYRYADRTLPGGTTKIDQEEEEKKKEEEEEKKKNTSRRPRPHAVVARELSSPARNRRPLAIFLPHEEKDRGNVHNFVPYRHTELYSVCYDIGVPNNTPWHITRSLGNIARPPTLFLVASNEEKNTATKLAPRKVLLVCDIVPRFSNRKRLRPSAKKKSSRRLAVRGQRRPRFSLFLFLSLFLAAARLIPPDSGRRRSKSTVTDLFQAVKVEIDRRRLVLGYNGAKTAPINGIAR